MKMYFNQSKVTGVVFLCSLLYAFDKVWADDMRSYRQISKPLVLHTLPIHGRFGHYDTAEIFCDAENHIIVLCRFGFWDNDNRKDETLLLASEKETWVKNTIHTWGGMINNGVFQVYRLEDITRPDDTSRRTGMSIYNIERDLSLSPKPTNTFEVGKLFTIENGSMITDLLPLSDKKDEFFIAGYYSESRLLNPLNFVGYMMSGGHWGFVRRPFGALVEQGQIARYYSTPEKLKTNENSEVADATVSKNEIHCVGIKSNEYRHGAGAIQYLSFDLNKKHWEKPFELFRGHKGNKETREVFRGLSIAGDMENVFCCWLRNVFDESSDYTWPILTGESGIYFCSRTNGVWGKPFKIVDFINKTGESPITVSGPEVLVDKNGAVRIFWAEWHKGLFHKCKNEEGWSDTILLVNDEAIRMRRNDISVSVDNANNFHIIYIRDSSGTFGKEEFKPEELVYVKVSAATEQPAEGK